MLVLKKQKQRLHKLSESWVGEDRFFFFLQIGLMLHLIMYETCLDSCHWEGRHTLHIPLLNGRLLLKRRHPSSTSHPEPVIDGLSMALFTQCFLYSHSAAVGRRNEKFSTLLKRKCTMKVMNLLCFPSKNHKRYKEITFRCITKKAFLALQLAYKQKVRQTWTEVEPTPKWLPPTTVNKEL